jgi:alpha-D-ribose 1-methylphosphonate 5-triphosphate synthase subunit PhnH
MTGLAPAHHAADVDFAQLEPGFADPVHGAQKCFRAVLDAMSHPGKIVPMPAALAGSPPAAMSSGMASVALILCDFDTPVWLDAAAAGCAGYLTFHCGAPIVGTPDEARFAFITDAAALPPLDAFALGSDEYPERSATLVIEVSDLTASAGIVLRGPGICGETRFGVSGLPARFWEERVALTELFPRGLDVLFVSGDQLAALPRSTRIAR